jgi:tRNA U34 5-methylaminomethyl-2-thiouridine-forming methyltransferase MnmC
MKRHIQKTEDGSHTLYVPDMDEHYHSIHGARQESMHVFIEAGLNQHPAKELTIFEAGFGTGLNAWLTARESKRQERKIDYYAIEKFPIKEAEWLKLTPGQEANDDGTILFDELHRCPWEKLCAIDTTFRLHKTEGDLTRFSFRSLPLFDLVYFDAFAPDKQPELWSPEIFEAIFAQMAHGGILVTYSAKGSVRRTLQSTGFQVERIPGPPGKREMLRGRKP